MERAVIIVCGEVILDVLRAPEQGLGERPAKFVGHPGGSPANTAVALARLGSASGLLARIATTSLGRLLREHLEQNGVDLSYAISAHEPASLAFVDVAANGSASYSFYVEGTADWQWTSDEFPDPLPDEVRIVHAGSIAAVTAPGRTAIAAMLEAAHSTRMVSFDPNIRPALIGDAAAARVLIEQLIGSVHLVKASDEDAAWLYPGDPVDDVAARWLALGPSLVVVTSGPNGATGFTRVDRVERPAPPVDVVDTVAAGDSFMAGLLHFIERAELVGLVRGIGVGARDLARALDYASAVAALACAKVGADPPYADEVDAFISAVNES